MNIESVVCIVIISIVVVCGLIYKALDTKWYRIVFENSQLVKSLIQLNATISFLKFSESYKRCYRCTSKRQFDGMILDEYFILLIDENVGFYKNLIDAISFNKKTYKTYLDKTALLSSSVTQEQCEMYGISLGKFLKYEEYIFHKNILDEPQVDVEIICKVTYSSPQGRNNYYKERIYNYSLLKEFYNQTVELKSQRQTRQYQIKLERAKMTDSLRYDILKRDKFRCQICGSCAQDGVKLHVDHIIPVSKGGQTIASNLRVLCDRCNMGKSDKV